MDFELTQQPHQPQPIIHAPTTAQALLAGACAGTAVDTILFPLDTIKTRLQSKEGFRASGGFRGVYSGLSSAVIGSAPGASAFFITYEYLKKRLSNVFPNHQPIVHMISAAGGEVGACIIRVPTEIVKQRLQTGQYRSFVAAVGSIRANEGVGGFYRGYLTTVLREIPFSFIQFPLYEYFKTLFKSSTTRHPEPWESALYCGTIAGGISAALTTPLDVMKTRIMLSKGKIGFRECYKNVVREEGYGALFKGIGPRVMWISIGGCIFLGVYEKVKKTLMMAEYENSI